MTAAVDETLRALADPKRRAVVDLLRARPLRSGELAEALTMSHPATSRHLRVLRKAGIVRERAHEEDLRVRIYELRPEPFRRLKTWVEEVEAFWTDQLDAFRAYAEGGE